MAAPQQRFADVVRDRARWRTISGAVEYQACDDKVCFNPTRVPVMFTTAVKGLDRHPPGD